MPNKNFFQKHIRAIIILGVFFFIPLLILFLRPDTDPTKTPTKPDPTIAPKLQTYDEQVKEGKLAPASKILEVVISYDRDRLPQMTVASLRKLNGYVPTTIKDDHELRVQLLDANKKVLSEQSFTVPAEQNTETFGPDGKIKGGSRAVTKTDVVTTLAWNDAGASVQIVNKAGSPLASSDLSQLVTAENTPSFKSIQGDQFLNPSEKPQSFNPFVKQAHAQSGGSATKLDLAVISDKYTAAQFPQFHSEVDTITAGVLAIEPFKTRASQIAFHHVENTVDLQCASDPSIPDGRLIVCNSTVVMQQINTLGVPYDYVIVLTNNPIYGGSGGTIISISNGNGDQMARSVTHELGHTFARLLDEYTVVGEVGDGPIDNQVHNFGTTAADPQPVGDGNCYAGLPPASAWAGIVTDQEYREGCKFFNWYSPSQDSLMKTLTIDCFNTVSQGVFNRRFDQIAGQFPGGDVPVFPCNASVVPTSMISPAPSEVVPTYQCLSETPCVPTATLAPGEPTMTPDPSNPGITGTPTGTYPPITPGGSQPCLTTDSTGQNTVNHKRHHRESGGFLSQFILFLFQLILLLLQQSGGEIPSFPCDITSNT